MPSLIARFPAVLCDSQSKSDQREAVSLAPQLKNAAAVPVPTNGEIEIGIKLTRSTSGLLRNGNTRRFGMRVLWEIEG